MLKKGQSSVSSSIPMLICISAVLLSSLPINSLSSAAEARCPNGYHTSPSGDCEKVTHSGGLPRCPDGYHRSPDGDCERVSSGDTDKSGSSESDEGDDEDANEREGEVNTSSFSSETQVTHANECKGSADCFRGIVTEIVDGDTIDLNNVRIRLSMVNTPERGEAGYNEAIETTESICQVGSSALVDEDDGQKEGSYDRLIGAVYCNGSTTSLNEVLLIEGKAAVYEDFCGVSEFAKDDWVTRFGC